MVIELVARIVSYLVEILVALFEFGHHNVRVSLVWRFLWKLLERSSLGHTVPTNRGVSLICPLVRLRRVELILKSEEQFDRYSQMRFSNGIRQLSQQSRIRQWQNLVCV